MVKTISSRSSSRMPEQADDQGMGMGKVFILLGIHVITRRRVQRRRWGLGGQRAANMSMVT